MTAPAFTTQLAAWIVDELAAHGIAVAQVAGGTFRFTRPQHVWTIGGIRQRSDEDRQIEVRATGTTTAIRFDPLDPDLHPAARKADKAHPLTAWCATYFPGHAEVVAEILDAVTVVARADARRAGTAVPAPFRPTKRAVDMARPPWPFALVNPTDITLDQVRDGLRLKLGRADVEVTTFSDAAGGPTVVGTCAGRPFTINPLREERDVRHVLRRLTIQLIEVHGAGSVAA